MASSLETTKLAPCPFCEGPPVTIAKNMVGDSVVKDSDLEDPEGCYAYAFVFCHGCGAQGPWSDGTAFNRDHLNELIEMAVQEWNERSAKHRDLYDAGEKEGLNQWPRP